MQSQFYDNIPDSEEHVDRKGIKYSEQRVCLCWKRSHTFVTLVIFRDFRSLACCLGDQWWRNDRVIFPARIPNTYFQVGVRTKYPGVVQPNANYIISSTKMKFSLFECEEDTIMLIRHGYVSKRWTIEGVNLMSNIARRRVEAGVSRYHSTWPLIISVRETINPRSPRRRWDGWKYRAKTWWVLGYTVLFLMF